jgi:hypothetical protein
MDDLKPTEPPQQVCWGKRAESLRGYGSRVGTWYWIGVSVGLGAAAGVLLAGLAGRSRATVIAAGIAAGAAGAALGIGIAHWETGGWIDRLGGIAGALAGVLGALPVVLGALRRGGTRGGTAVLVAGAAVVIAGIAFIPAAGYLEALALPALAARLRRKQPERYAGLRTLARD